MAAPSVRNRLITASTSARYNLFLSLGGVLAMVGLILFGLAASGDNADRAWQLFHVNWVYFTGLTAGSLAFTAVQKITKARWSGLMVRFAEATAAFMVVSFVGFLVIFLVGYHHIYPAMEGLSPGKTWWLSHDVMFWRLCIGLLVMFWVGFQLIKADLVPDLFDVRATVTGARRKLYDRWIGAFDGSAAARAAQDARIFRLAPTFVVIFAIVATLVAFDGIMSLQPHWFSNLLGAFYFMGSFLGGHTLLAQTMLVGRDELGIADLVSPKQRHDLGKLCFGFTVFWGYLMFAQFLVIWYGNLPEETGFVFARLWGTWLPIGRAVFLGMFVIPFIGLLGVLPKKTPALLSLFTGVSLVALWLERYLLIVPSVTHEDGPMFGMPELGPTLLFLGLFMVCYALFARTFPMVSPRLAMITLSDEAAHAHQPDPAAVGAPATAH
jgi:Ni/Fe-hydrogenase subunit HybB-like protein